MRDVEVVFHLAALIEIAEKTRCHVVRASRSENLGRQPRHVAVAGAVQFGEWIVSERVKGNRRDDRRSEWSPGSCGSHGHPVIRFRATRVGLLSQEDQARAPNDGARLGR